MEVGALSSSLNSVSLGSNSSRGMAKMDTFRLHVVTWNVATAEPPSDFGPLLQLGGPRSADLYAIGLQEVNAALRRFVTDLAFEDSWSQAFMGALGPRGYVKITSIRMQGLLLLLFARLEHVPFVRDIETTYTRTGVFRYWGNKGGVSARLSFYGHALCFLNCHLAAHMEYADERVGEFRYILGAQSFNGANVPSILDHRVLFWFGDLNFRIAEHDMDFVRSAIDRKRLNLLWEKDQLSMMKQKEAFLQEFEEGTLSFNPTYKYDLFSDTYDTSVKQRKPAWTDRILWRVRQSTPPPAEEVDGPGPRLTGEQLQQRQEKDEDEEYPMRVKQDRYTCCMDYSISDHKPVVSTFSLEIRKKSERQLVDVRAEGEWCAECDALVAYSILEPFSSSTWDWIGLYKVGFRSPSDYITYTWVKDDEVSRNDEVVQVYVNKEEIPVAGGECLLCYYSNKMQCIVGISPPFQVQQSKLAVEEGFIQENNDGSDQTTAN